jgi:hypothetical protein
MISNTIVGPITWGPITSNSSIFSCGGGALIFVNQTAKPAIGGGITPTCQSTNAKFNVTDSGIAIETRLQIFLPFTEAYYGTIGYGAAGPGTVYTNATVSYNGRGMMLTILGSARQFNVQYFDPYTSNQPELGSASSSSTTTGAITSTTPTTTATESQTTTTALDPVITTQTTTISSTAKEFTATVGVPEFPSTSGLSPLILVAAMVPLIFAFRAKASKSAGGKKSV